MCECVCGCACVYVCMYICTLCIEIKIPNIQHIFIEHLYYTQLTIFLGGIKLPYLTQLEPLSL